MLYVKNYFILTSKYDEFFTLKATYFLCLLYLLWFHLCQNCLWSFELKLIIISLTRSYQTLNHSLLVLTEIGSLSAVHKMVLYKFTAITLSFRVTDSVFWFRKI